MTILIAPDKFKGSLTAEQVCEAIEQGIISIDPFIEVMSIPLADGGEGTGELLTWQKKGDDVEVTVLDPLFRNTKSSYGLSRDGKTAFIEMAKASGFQLLTSEERNPLYTTTFGTGQLIKAALDRGVSNIILGIGGSATNDAGIGMAEALGYSFWSAADEKLKPIGENLSKIHRIDSSNVHPHIVRTKFTVLCDVENPLSGKQGAAYVFGPQKGATPLIVQQLDEGLQHFVKVINRTLKIDLNFPGSGAAGGLGAGTKVFLHAEMKKGFDFIAEFTELEKHIEQSDLIITGEGKIDHQSLAGKVVRNVATLAAKHKKKCVAFAGICNLTSEEIRHISLDQVFSLADERLSEQESMRHAFALLKSLSAKRLKEVIS